MRKQTLLLIVSAFALGACSKTENGDLVVKRPADVNVTTTKDTLAMPSVGTRIDTVNTPVVGVQKDTVVVSKPVVGTKKSEVKVPVITKP